MERRQFMARCAAVGGALLGRNTFKFSRRNLGLGGSHVTSGKPLLPRSTSVSGNLVDVDGTTVTVDLTGSEPDGPVRVRVVRREYPMGGAVTAGVSDRVQTPDPGESERVRVTVPRDGRTPGAWFYEAQVESVTGDDARAYLCESRPYQWPSASGEELATADRVTQGYELVDEEWFERRVTGNDYVLSFRWQDPESDVWTVEYPIRRSTHEAAVAGERGYVQTYEQSLASPLVRDLAAALETDARPETTQPRGEDEETTATLASLDAGERFDQFVRFVQQIDYARDAASMDTYDYNRTPPETLVAGVGDCKDRTYLLAGLLTASFDCETALLFQPGHVLLGVEPSDVPSLPYTTQTVTLSGRELVPVEPSLSVPVSYYTNEPFVAAYGDGEWFHHDAGALGRGVDDVVKDWLDKTDVVPQVF